MKDMFRANSFDSGDFNNKTRPLSLLSQPPFYSPESQQNNTVSVNWHLLEHKNIKINYK